MDKAHSPLPAKRGLLATALLAAALLAAPVTAHAAPDVSAFPDGDATSGRFTNIVNGLESLGEDEQGAAGVGGTRLMIEVCCERLEFRLGIFDGDYSVLWDYLDRPSMPLVEYLLCPDVSGAGGANDGPDRFPDRDGDGNTIILERWTSADMLDSQWFECTTRNSSTPKAPGRPDPDTGVATHPEAKVTDPTHPSYGDFRYVLVVRWATPVEGNAMNCFKVRAQGQVFGPAESRFGIMGFKWATPPYGGSIPWKFRPAVVGGPWSPPYEKPYYFDIADPITTYDGSWNFFWNLPLDRAPYSKLDLWNGDWDVAEDTNDPHSDGIPPWVPAGNQIVHPETSNPGFPQDDLLLALEPGYAELYPLSIPVLDTNGQPLTDEEGRRVGILHRVIFPDGLVITELNPSGNREWENFQIAVRGSGYEPEKGALVDAIPVGEYIWRIEGVDEQNTLFLRPDFDLFAEFGHHAIGDRVFWDTDGDPSEDTAGEPGINDVKVDLYYRDDAGQWVYYGSTSTRTVTDPGDATKTIDGYYVFDFLGAGEWKAVVDVEGSPVLAGALPVYDRDGGQDCTTLVGLSANESQHDVDFSFRLTCAPGTGTPGYWKNHPEAWPVTTILIGGTAWSREDAIRRMKKATAGGNKANTMFMHLVAAKLNVLAGNSDAPIRDTILAADAWMATYDGTSVSDSSAAWREGEPLAQRLDAYNNGLLPGAPSRDVVNLVAGEDNLDADFGYRKTCYDQTGKIGDFVYLRKKNTCGTGYVNVGLSGVRVELYTSGAFAVSTTTNSSGYYGFSGLAAGGYEVRIVASTLPAGVSPYYDCDGISTAHTAAVALAAGQRNLDVDFGYQKYCPPSGKIGDFVYVLRKQICGYGYTRVGISGVTVELWLDANSDGTPESMLAAKVTDANGLYLFGALEAGKYEVRVDKTTLPADLAPCADLDGVGTPHRAALALSAGQANLDVDFGYKKVIATCTPPPPCGGGDEDDGDDDGKDDGPGCDDDDGKDDGPGCDGDDGKDNGPGCDGDDGGDDDGGRDDGDEDDGSRGSGGSTWHGGIGGGDDSSSGFNPFRDWLDSWRASRSNCAGW